MPGRRLTPQDRERIAAGLAAGLGYADIARSLGRPTSTVSREVTRNGGPEAYRAAAAQRDTTRRARRVRTGAASDGPPAGVRAFEERFADVMAATSMPRMPARVLVCLLTSEDGLAAADLVHRLQVSPATVSKAVTYLEEMLLVTRHRDPDRRRERYRVDDDAWYRACVREVRMCEAWSALARDGATALDGSPAAARLDQMSRYFAHVGTDLARSAERWRSVFDRP